MKLIVALVFFFHFSSALAEGEAFINYTYGNQSVGSYVQIFETGEVKVTERKCCPLKVKKSFKKKLEAKQVERLKELLLDARLGPYVHYRAKVAPKTMFGSLEGKSRHYNVVIREREHADQWVTRNESKAGKEIIEMLRPFMPKNQWK